MRVVLEVADAGAGDVEFARDLLRGVEQQLALLGQQEAAGVAVLEID